MSSSDTAGKFWERGDLCCCLFRDDNPVRYHVDICSKGRQVLTEPVQDPGEAPDVAERLWRAFIELRPNPSAR